MSGGEAATVVARLATLSARLSRPGGPHYAILAQIAGLVEQMTALETPDHPLVGAIVASLSRVLTYPLHDHPKFIELIDVHASALQRVMRDEGGLRGEELMRRIAAAVDKVVPEGLLPGEGAQR